MLLISSNDIKIDHTKVAGYGREDREYDSQYLNLSRPKNWRWNIKRNLTN